MTLPKKPEGTTIYHPHLTAQPCNSQGQFLDTLKSPEPPSDIPEDDNNSWAPFRDRRGFEFADEHYVKIQSSARNINKALDLWQATSITLTGSSDDCPWHNTQSMYQTIDEIQTGDIPWTTFTFTYDGPQPENPPQWMLETYELSTRNVLDLVRQQLENPEFDGKFDYRPYEEFNPTGERIWTNLFSGGWAWKQADVIVKDPATHGSMFVPVVAGSDKTTVSIATGHQEYHPVYISVGNLHNSARRAHGQGVQVAGFLPIPKASKAERSKPLFINFCRQLYHECLKYIFEPLRENMTVALLVRCPDGHYRWAIFGLGPYIADYPEQVWLSGIVSNWCPRCCSQPSNLDGDGSTRFRSHEKTAILLNLYNTATLWDDHGIRDNVRPFTSYFPRADIHQQMAPDILHQLIKGVFKDHLVSWVQAYIRRTHSKQKALKIIEDIDHRDYTQWTGDDSKALMKVYIASITGYVPSKMVQCISAFLNAYYIVRRNSITSTDVARLKAYISQFHKLRQIFIETGIRDTISLPRQHALTHYPFLIPFFGSPNGLCLSITESKHIAAVKEPWRRSSRFNALSQMLLILCRLNKMAYIRQRFASRGMLQGTAASHALDLVRQAAIALRTRNGNQDRDKTMPSQTSAESTDIRESEFGSPAPVDDFDEEDDSPESGCEPVEGDRSPNADFSVTMAARIAPAYLYPRDLDLPLAFRHYLFLLDNPGHPADAPLPSIDASISTFYAPSDLCGAGGMKRERIRSKPAFHGVTRRDTVLVDESKSKMKGMTVGRVELFFSFKYRQRAHNFGDSPDPDTGMWMVEPEFDDDGSPTCDVVSLNAIVRAYHHAHEFLID
ncbi:hypothetical protein BJ165DRAFT_1416380 [Panaeolus papilionaceus]|nr:hypothetical protein BJ165DRAFT_1416380 [Panaeolus papilionaceus]